MQACNKKGLTKRFIRTECNKCELIGVECAGTPGRVGLLRNLGEGEGESVELTEVGVGRRSGGVVPATERIGGGGRSSTGATFRARRGGDDNGNELWRWQPGCCALL
jgi:hypothetical protein